MKNKSFKCLQSLFLAIVLTAVAVTGLPLAGGPNTAPAGHASGQGYRGAVHQ